MSRIHRQAFVGSGLGALLLPAAARGSGYGDIEKILGPGFRAANPGRQSPRHAAPAFDLTSAMLRWNRIAIDCSGLDHLPPGPGETRVFGQQLGPCRASRAMAIVHLAIYQAVAAGAGRSLRDGTAQAAIAQAAHDTLVHLFPAQTADLDQDLADDLTVIGDEKALCSGVQAGRRSAAAVLAARAADGSEVAEPKVGIDHFTSDQPGHWRADPVSQSPLALGAYWGSVRPFVIRSGTAFRLPPPPALASPEYALAFSEAQRLGGDGMITPTLRTADQTIVGIFWAYDGTPSLCAPPRLYNQVATTIAAQRRTEGLALVRLLTLINVAMADAGIAIWDSKYFHDFWRPVTGIRESDAGTGPSGLGDGNPATIGDRQFMPLGAPASNLVGPNFTPPFPAYPSGHAGFGGALFQTLRRFYDTDNIAFSFMSDEFNGVTRDHTGKVRPNITRNFASLSAAEEENGQSRIYLGIHWAFDKTAGIAQGRRVADYVFDRFHIDRD